MIILNNDKNKTYLKIMIKSESVEKELIFYSIDVLSIPILETIENAKKEAKETKFDIIKSEKTKIINHIVGSLHDYYKFLKNAN